MTKKESFKFNRTSCGSKAFWIASILLLTLVSLGCGGGGSDGGGGGDGNEASQRFTLEYANLRFRCFETDANDGYRGAIGIADNGGPIQETDVTGVELTDPGGNPVTISDEDSGVYSFNYLLYDCTNGPCASEDTIEESGIWANLDSLQAGVYHADVSMINGQTLGVDVDYPGQTFLPIVLSRSMSASYNRGDLELSWENPDVDDWSLVTRLRVQIIDGGSPRTTVLCIDLPPTENSITIPEYLLTEAENLGNGTADRWRIQSRAYDATNMNYARSYSNYVDLP